MSSAAIRFKQLHESDNTFIMANAWDPGSAIILEEAGFACIGTTSAGIAYSHGVPDSEGKLPFDTALDETRRIVDAVSVPVSMDSENLYAESLDEVTPNMKRIVASGVAGASIEDNSGDPDNPLYEVELAVDRVRAAREACSNQDRPFILTARAECYLVGHEKPFHESVKRVNRYREAGADCLYVPGIRDIATIRNLVNEVDGPINVVMGLAGTPISVAELEDAGVKRISIGGSLARSALGLVRRAAREMLVDGTFTFSGGQIPDPELCKLFAARQQD